MGSVSFVNVICNFFTTLRFFDYFKSLNMIFQLLQAFIIITMKSGLKAHKHYCAFHCLSPLVTVSDQPNQSFNHSRRKINFHAKILQISTLLTFSVNETSLSTCSNTSRKPVVCSHRYPSAFNSHKHILWMKKMIFSPTYSAIPNASS